MIFPMTGWISSAPTIATGMQRHAGPRAPGARSRRGRSGPGDSARGTACRRPSDPRETRRPARPRASSGIAVSVDARTPPMRATTLAIQPERNAKLATSGRTRRWRGWSRWMPCISIAPSYGMPPEWLATSSAAPVVGDVLDAEQAHAEVARPEELQQRRRALEERRVVAAVGQLLRALRRCGP